MKNFIITSQYNENDIKQIPVIMELYQYQRSVSALNQLANNEIFQPKGSVGNLALTYSVDCSWVTSDAKNLIDLRNIYSGTKNPAISRDYISSRFWIYAIPDYGHQSMSPFYQDFIPMVYNISGEKLNQGAVGLLRIFTNKQAFILIDKIVFAENPGDLAIRIVFKANIDTGESLATIENIGGNTRKDGVFEYSYKLDEDPNKLGIDFFLTSPTDYEIIYKNKNESKSYIIQNYAINFLDIEMDIYDGRYVRKQGGEIDENGDFVVRDYFSQAMQRDYSNSKGNYQRNIDYRISIDIGIQTDTGDSISIRSKQYGIVFSNISFQQNSPDDNYECVSLGYSTYFYNLNDFSIYCSEGNNAKTLKRIPTTEFIPIYDSYGVIKKLQLPLTSKYVSYQTFHLIPEYNNSRKIDMYFTTIKEMSNQDINELIRKVLFKNNIAGWNQQENSEKLIFVDGELYTSNESSISVPAGKLVEIIIFDRMENYTKKYKTDTDGNIIDDTETTSDINDLEIKIVYKDEVAVEGESSNVNLYKSNKYTVLYDPFLLIGDEEKYHELDSEIFLQDRKNELGMDGLWFDPEPSTLSHGEHSQLDLFYQHTNNGVYMYYDNLTGNNSFSSLYTNLTDRNKRRLHDMNSYFTGNSGAINLFAYDEEYKQDQTAVSTITTNIGKVRKIDDEIWTIRTNLKSYVKNSSLLQGNNDFLVGTSDFIPQEFFFAFIRINSTDEIDENIIIELKSGDDIVYREYIQNSDGEIVLLPIWNKCEIDKENGIKLFKWKNEKDLEGITDWSLFVFK